MSAAPAAPWPMGSGPHDLSCAVPEDVPIAELEVEPAFNGLTAKEKLYAHHMSRGSWYGSLVCLFQTSVEAPHLFGLFMRVFASDSVASLKNKALSSGVSAEEFGWFMQYVGSFLGNMGNYLSFGDTKFIPRLRQTKFCDIVRCSSFAKKEELESLIAKGVALAYDTSPRLRQLGLENEGVSTYYSADITKADIEIVSEWMCEKDMLAYNTRVFKVGPNQYELWLACSEQGTAQTVQHKGVTITVRKGDYHELMKKLEDEIVTAGSFAANDHQRAFCAGYAKSFRAGDINDHVEASRHWIKDKGPAVETYIGFIESYRDPFGVRGEFEGFVAVVNREMSKKFTTLVTNAPDLLKHLPWPSEYEKDVFLKPDFTSLDVLTFASSGVPAGINIPNYDNVRQSDGFKNVSLGNVLASRQSNERVTFLRDQDQDMFTKLMPPAFEVQVGLHELLGHGSGKLLGENPDGTLNFDRGVKDPYTGQPVTTWYKKGENYDSKFAAMSSSYEECRAECTGIFLCVLPDVLTIFGYDPASPLADDIVYTNWLIMARAGLLALEFYTPETKTWRQAHMRARYAILQTMLRHGDGVASIVGSGDSLHVEVDRSKIRTSGIACIGDFLGRLSVYKSLGDFDRASKMFNGLSEVTDRELGWRGLVMEQKKPRKLFVQSNTFIDNGKVILKRYEGSNEGLVQSFVDRFEGQREHLFRIFK